MVWQGMGSLEEEVGESAFLIIILENFPLIASLSSLYLGGLLFYYSETETKLI